ncbi:MAG: hypothetical protein IKA36_00110 [Clostridia bacterium]|nr:hypothetical protein [Clostridia bacterium]
MGNNVFNHIKDRAKSIDKPGIGLVVDKSITKLGAGSKKNQSIISKAKQNIFEFPVFMSDSTPVDYATATVSLLDQVYMSYLASAISVNPYVSMDKLMTGNAFSELKSDTSKYLEHTDMSYAHDACHFEIVNEGVALEFNLMTISDKTATIINEAYDYEPLSEFDHFFQEGKGHYKDKNNNKNNNRPKTANDPAVEKQLGEMIGILNEIRDDVKKGNKSANDQDNLNDKADLLRKQYEDLKNIKDENGNPVNIQQAEYDRIMAQIKQIIQQSDDEVFKKKLQKLELEIEGERVNNISKSFQSSGSALRRKMNEESIKGKIDAPKVDETVLSRINTMKPMVTAVTLRPINLKTGQAETAVEYNIAVKTHTRLIDSSTLPEVAEYPLKEMNKLTRKAKWRAGELKFFKDILFNIKGKKQSAIDSRDPKRKWYTRLYNLAHTQGDAVSASIFTKKFTSDGLIPNATIVITKDDVDNIRAKTDIDLLDGKTAVKFCRELFLIGFVVLDTDAESLKILLPDLHNDFEIHSLASVNKQLAMLDSSGTKAREISKLLK